MGGVSYENGLGGCDMRVGFEAGFGTLDNAAAMRKRAGG